MATKYIEAVQLDENGRISKVRWGVINPATAQWEQGPSEGDADDVVAAIMGGDQLRALTPGGTTDYVLIKVDRDARGNRWLAVNEVSHHGRAINEIRTF